MVNKTTHNITTFAGNGTRAYLGDNGPATLASLHSPQSVWGSTLGAMYIVDSTAHVVRVVISDIITTFAGTGTSGYNGDHIPASMAALDTPFDVKGDSIGRIFILENVGCRIRMVDNSIITTVVGTGLCAFSPVSPQIASTATINLPIGLWVDSVGKIFFTERDGYVRYLALTLPTANPTSVPTSDPTSPSSQPTSQPSFQPTVFIGGAASSLKQGLVAYYPFDGNALDKSGNGNNGLVRGGVSVVSDRFGRSGGAYSFNGLDGYIEVPGEEFNFAVNFSLSLWVNPAATQTGYNRLFDKGTLGINAGGFTMQQEGSTTNYYVVNIVDPQDVFVISTSIQLLSGKWQHLLLTKSNRLLYFYVDGVSVLTYTMPLFIKDTGSASLLIGAYGATGIIPETSAGGFFHGELDDLLIFNRSLSLEEIELLGGLKTPTSTPSQQPTAQPSQTLARGIISYFPLDGSVEDVVGGNDGIFNGGVTATANRFGVLNSAMLLDGVSHSYLRIRNGENYLKEYCVRDRLCSSGLLVGKLDLERRWIVTLARTRMDSYVDSLPCLACNHNLIATPQDIVLASPPLSLLPSLS